MHPDFLTPGVAHVIHAGKREQPYPFVVSSTSNVRYDSERGCYGLAAKGRYAVVGLIPLGCVYSMIMSSIRRGSLAGFEELMSPARERAAELRGYIDNDQGVQLDVHFTVAPPSGWRWELLAPRQLRAGDFWEYVTGLYLSTAPDGDRMTWQIDVHDKASFDAVFGEVGPLAARHHFPFTMQWLKSGDDDPGGWKVVAEPADLLTLLRRLDEIPQGA